VIDATSHLFATTLCPAELVATIPAGLWRVLSQKPEQKATRLGYGAGCIGISWVEGAETCVVLDGDEVGNW